MLEARTGLIQPESEGFYRSVYRPCDYVTMWPCDDVNMLARLPAVEESEDKSSLRLDEVSPKSSASTVAIEISRY